MRARRDRPDKKIFPQAFFMKLVRNRNNPTSVHLGHSHFSVQTLAGTSNVADLEI
jgi:hypothetical protein